MIDGKGKGRARSDEDTDKGQSDEPPSMLSRVAASAGGLTRSAFAHPNTKELNERTATALADIGKGQTGQSSSSRGSSAWAESSITPHRQSNQASAAGTFRAEHSGDHIRQSENEFSSFLDGIDAFVPSESTREGLFKNGDFVDDFGVVWARSQSTATAEDLSAPNIRHQGISEQQERDGDQVLAILAGNKIVEEFEPLPEEDESYDWGLSAEQLSQLRAMTKELFPSPGIHRTISSDHSLNLAPNFKGAYGQPATGSDVWRDQWDGVLNRYTDEVWGNLLPLVKEARKEIETLQNDPAGTSGGQPKALRRLGAILGHLRM